MGAGLVVVVLRGFVLLVVKVAILAGVAEVVATVVLVGGDVGAVIIAEIGPLAVRLTVVRGVVGVAVAGGGVNVLDPIVLVGVRLVGRLPAVLSLVRRPAAPALAIEL